MSPMRTTEVPITHEGNAEWTLDAVRAELDAIAKLHNIGTFRSRYTLSTAELFILVDKHLKPHERVLCLAILRSHVQDRLDETIASCPAFLSEQEEGAGTHCPHGKPYSMPCSQDGCDTSYVAFQHDDSSPWGDL